ncbi:MAG: hypothetical protein RSD23_06570 [Ruthenibacterium sp.]
MAKMYTLDDKLLTEVPEIRIADKVYPVDNRKKTVLRIMELSKESTTNADSIDKAIAIAMGEDTFAEINAMDLTFPAYQKLFELLMAAVTGEEPETVAERFQKSEKTAK